MYPNCPLSAGYAIPPVGINVPAPATEGYAAIAGANIIRWQSAGLLPAVGGKALGDPSLRWGQVHAAAFAPGQFATTVRRLVGVTDGAVQTAGGVTSAIATISLDDLTESGVEVRVVARRQATDEGANYRITAAYRRNGAGVTITGAASADVTQEDDATANAALVIVGTTVEVRGTSPAAKTYNWYASVDIVKRAD